MGDMRLGRTAMPALVAAIVEHGLVFDALCKTAT